MTDRKWITTLDCRTDPTTRLADPTPMPHEIAAAEEIGPVCGHRGIVIDCEPCEMWYYRPKHGLSDSEFDRIMKLCDR